MHVFVDRASLTQSQEAKRLLKLLGVIETTLHVSAQALSDNDALWAV